MPLPVSSEKVKFLVADSSRTIDTSSVLAKCTTAKAVEVTGFQLALRQWVNNLVGSVGFAHKKKIRALVEPCCPKFWNDQASAMRWMALH